jgi:hypothetical protein
MGVFDYHSLSNRTLATGRGEHDGLEDSGRRAVAPSIVSPAAVMPRPPGSPVRTADDSGPQPNTSPRTPAHRVAHAVAAMEAIPARARSLHSGWPRHGGVSGCFVNVFVILPSLK